jgi:uncharacterized membrane protein
MVAPNKSRSMTTTHKHNLLAAALAAVLTITAPTLPAQDAAADDKAAAAELAKKLQNPVASLVSVPIQNNWDFGIGPASAMRYTANIQPVIPFSLNTNWNLITRTIVPVIYAESPTIGGSSKSGLGDTVQSFFFRPRPRPAAAGFGARVRSLSGPRPPMTRSASANSASAPRP